MLRAQTPVAIDAIKIFMRKTVGAYKHGEWYDIPMPAALASAVKP